MICLGGKQKVQVVVLCRTANLWATIILWITLTNNAKINLPIKKWEFG
jgi:hypothetical protein